MSAPDASWVQALGWTALHFLWQGAAVAFVVGVAWIALRRASAESRYCVGVVGLVTMIVLPIVTFWRLCLQDVAPMGTLVISGEPIETWVSQYERSTPWIALSWLAGASLLQARSLIQWTRAMRLRRSGQPVGDNWRRELEAAASSLGVRRRVRLLESGRAEVPMVIGWLAPVILVPTYALTQLTPEQLRQVLAHELAHIRRHDYLVNLLQSLLESLLFFHPAVWWLSRRLREEREYCCDDLAIRIGGNAIGYARALATLEESRSVSFEPAVAVTGGSLMNRILRIVDGRTASARSPWSWLATIALVVIVGGAAAHIGFAETVSPQDDDDKVKERHEVHLQHLHEMLAKYFHKLHGPDEKVRKDMVRLHELEKSELHEAMGISKEELTRRMTEMEKAQLHIHVQELEREVAERKKHIHELKKQHRPEKLHEELQHFEKLQAKLHHLKSGTQDDEAKLHEHLMKLREKGLTDAELHEHMLQARDKMEEARRQREVLHAVKLKAMVEELRAQGLSQEEIKKKLAEMEIYIKKAHEKSAQDKAKHKHKTKPEKRTTEAF
ncbi:MAG: M56 family metallopeptidase [Planctomycetota bacterium]